MKQVWHRLGTPDAISWVLVLLATIQIIAGSLTAPYVDITGREWLFVIARIISLGCALIVLGIGKLLLVRFARTRPLPWLTLIIFMLSTVVISASMNWLMILLEFTNEWNILRRIIVGIPGFFAILVLSGILVSYARESARRNKELAETAAELVHTRLQTSQQLQNKKETLIATVQREIENSITNTNTQNPHNTTEALRALIDDVVRPMSYQLSSEVTTFSVREISAEDTAISWRQIFKESVRANPSHPLTTTLWTGGLLGAFLITGFGISGLVATSALIVAEFAVLMATKLLWKFIPPAIPDWFRALIFSSTVLIFTMSTNPALTFITGYDFTAPRAVTGWFLLCLFMTWTVTLVSTIDSSLKNTYDTLIATIDELKREVINLNSEIRILQKQLSRILHGPIQEIITASLIRIQSGATTTTDAELIADLRKKVLDSLSLLDQKTEPQVNFEDSLAQLVELWDEVVKIHIKIDPEELKFIAADPMAANTLTELIREGCNNALRHGEAHNIHIEATVQAKEHAIMLTVKNDGSALPAQASSGLGTEIFEEMCLSWSRSQEPTWVRVEARIPFNAEPVGLTTPK